MDSHISIFLESFNLLGCRESIFKYLINTAIFAAEIGAYIWGLPILSPNIRPFEWGFTGQ